MDKLFIEAVRQEFTNLLKSWPDAEVEKIISFVAGKYGTTETEIIRAITKEPSYATSQIAAETDTRN